MILLERLQIANDQLVLIEDARQALDLLSLISCLRFEVCHPDPFPFEVGGQMVVHLDQTGDVFLSRAQFPLRRLDVLPQACSHIRIGATVTGCKTCMRRLKICVRWYERGTRKNQIVAKPLSIRSSVLDGPIHHGRNAEASRQRRA